MAIRPCLVSVWRRRGRVMKPAGSQKLIGAELPSSKPMPMIAAVARWPFAVSAASALARASCR
eukprot:7148509-Heterocapsa_arctica.AAC.1